MDELAKQMEENQIKRARQMQDFISDLEAKYGGKKKKRESITNGDTPSKRTRSSRK